MYRNTSLEAFDETDVVCLDSKSHHYLTKSARLKQQGKVKMPKKPKDFVLDNEAVFIQDTIRSTANKNTGGKTPSQSRTKSYPIPVRVYWGS